MVTCAGAIRRENAGMSNRKSSENLDRRKPKVSSAMAIIGGLGVPKDNRAFERGRPMVSRLIFRPYIQVRRDDGEYKVTRIIGFDASCFKDACQENPAGAVRHIRRQSKPSQDGI